MWLQKRDSEHSVSVSSLHSSAEFYVTVVGSVPENRAGTRDINDDNYVNMYTCMHSSLYNFHGINLTSM